MSQTLSKEMQQHTYAIMNRVENEHWWYVGRRAILESFLEGIIQNPKSRIQNPKILDVGCGTGGNLEMLKKFGTAEGVDVSDEALEFCKSKGLTVHKGLAEKLPFADETFDVVTALDVVEHLDDDIAGLKEMQRVLKKRRQNADFRTGVYVALGRAGRRFKSPYSLHEKTNRRAFAKSWF